MSSDDDLIVEQCLDWRDYMPKRLESGAWFDNRRWCLLVLGLTCLLLYSDQNIIAPNLTAIADEFGFDEQERDNKLGGDVALGFFLVGAPMAVLTGYLADTMNRTVLFGFITSFASVACMASFFVQTYEQFFAARILTGIGVGGAPAVVFSLLADFYDIHHRNAVATYIMIMMVMGQSVGQGISGMLGPHYGWRLPFLVIGAPALTCGLLVILTCTEPPRGDQEEEMLLAKKKKASVPVNRGKKGESGRQEAHSGMNVMGEGTRMGYSMRGTTSDVIVVDKEGAVGSYASKVDEMQYGGTIDWEKVKVLLKTPTVLLIIFQGLPGCIPWGVFWVFLNDYLSQDRGLKVHQATALLTVFGVGTVVGVLSGGALGRWLYARDKRYMLYMMGGSTCLSIVPLLILFNGDAKHNYNNGFFFFVSFAAGVLMSMTGVNIKVVLQNVTTPETRGTAFAIHSLTDDLGKGGGPALVAALIVAMGRQSALNLSAFMVLPCGLSILGIAFFVHADEARVQEVVRATVRREVAPSSPTLEMAALSNGEIYGEKDAARSSRRSGHVGQEKTNYKSPLHL